MPMRSAAVLIAVLLLTACGPQSHGDTSHPRPSQSPFPRASAAAPAIAFPDKPNVFYLRMFGVEGWSSTWVASEPLPRAFKTIDAGGHWSLQAVDGGVMAMYALDPQRAWVAFKAASGVAIAATSDGGRSWNSSTPVGNADSVGSLRFLDSLNGTLTLWSAGASPTAASASAFRTADGGATWLQLAVPTAAAGCRDVWDVVLVDRTRAFLSPGFCPVQAPLLATSDGGTTWSPARLPPAPWIGTAGFSTISGVNVPEFPNPNDGYIVGAAGTTTGANALQHAWLYRSHDGGGNWSVASLPATPGETDFSRSPSLWFVGYENGDNDHSILYHSRDAGASWQRLTAMTFQPRSIRFSDDLHALAAGFDGIYATFDGGRTWVDARTRP